MYSSESGVETDQEARSEECKLVLVVPNKAQYNAKERLVLIFNNILSDKGSYHVEFKGHKRSKMDVKAYKVNKCTLVVEAPIYHPVENVNINVRHRTYEGSTIIGTIPFRFLSREEILADILRDYMGDPVTFMCESLRISPTDICALDDALAVTFKRNMPKGFNLLGLHNKQVANEASNSLHPTLLHFAAAFGLLRLTKDCLLQCPGVLEASKMKNSRGMQPNEIALNGGYEDLAEEIIVFQAQNEDSIYECMEKENGVDGEYLQMTPGYINLQLWPESYVEMEHKENQEDDFYEDMSKNKEADVHGYIDVNRQDVESDQLYTDMNESLNEKEKAPHYIDVKQNEQVEDIYMNYKEDSSQDVDNQQLYETMEGDTGLGDDQNEGYSCEYREGQPTYDTPSNLPVSCYPEARSASVSYGAGGARRPKKFQKDFPQEPNLPPVPARLSRMDPTSPRERLSSTASKISNLSNTSTSSGASTSTTGSGHEGDAEDDGDDGGSIMMSREQLMRQLENKKLSAAKQKERPQVAPKTSRFPGPSRPQESYQMDCPLPPVPPPADYGQITSPPPVPSRGQSSSSPRGPRHERSKTAPVNTRDVELAQMPNRTSSRSTKESSGTRQSQGTRPQLGRHPTSDLTYNRPPVEERRNSSEAPCTRPPAPAPFSPVDRPPAPVPKEPVKDNRGSRIGLIPTPLLSAIGQASSQVDNRQPRPQPRPAPRKKQ